MKYVDEALNRMFSVQKDSESVQKGNDTDVLLVPMPMRVVPMKIIRNQHRKERVWMHFREATSG
jgi:hypothetical protein